MERISWPSAQFIRFLGVGLLNTGFGYAVFVGLVAAGLSSSAALLLATAAGVAFNFQTARALVFAAPGRFGRFASIYVGLLIINWVALSGLGRLGVAAWAAQGLLVLPLALLSFAAQKLLVFGRTTLSV